MANLIALDSDLADSLLQTLEQNRLELARLREKETGNEPMTIEQGAQYLQVARSTFCTYLKRKEIIPSEYGGRVWVLRKELDRFLERHRRKN